MGRSIKQKNLIHVVPGDVIAIFQEGPALARYITCDPASPTDPTICAEDLLIFSSDLEPAPGDQVSFTTRQSVYLGTSNVRGYAVVAYLDDREITVSGSLTLNYPSTAYVVTVLVTDVCGGTGRCNISITVTNDPKPITLISLPETKQLGIWAVGEVHAFQISDQRDVDNVTCYVVPKRDNSVPNNKKK